MTPSDGVDEILKQVYSGIVSPTDTRRLYFIVDRER